MSGSALAGGMGSAINLWEQQPGEPDHWYGRFQLYLNLGPTRNVSKAYRAYHCERTDMKYTNTWCDKAVQWHWRERAHAWDAYQRNLLALSERNLRIGLRQSRIGVTEEALEHICAALERAEIGEADREQARAWLPHLWRSLRDMLVVQRQEFEHDFTGDDPAEEVAITADDLRAAQRALEGQDGLPAPRQAPIAPRRSKRGTYSMGCTFLVCTGADSELLLGLAALREVRAGTGLRFQRVLQATKRKLSVALRRQRGLGYPIQHLHMAPRATGEGVELADGVVDWAWLNKWLEGVQVLVLASCAGDRVGEQIHSVPYVVALDEHIPQVEAAALVQAFWHGIGEKQEPGAALALALGRCALPVGEMVWRQW